MFADQCVICTHSSLCTDVVDMPPPKKKKKKKKKEKKRKEKKSVTIVQSCREDMHQRLSRLSCEIVPHVYNVPELGEGCVLKLLNVMVHAELACKVYDNTQIPCRR